MPKKQTAREMRKELAKVCDEVPPRSCGSGKCRLSRMCAVFGNPRTTDSESVKAMYLLFLCQQGGQKHENQH